MNKPFGGLILNIAFRMLVPFTMVYAVYILCLGEFSPGGGFQAGALLSVGVLLARLILADASGRGGFLPELQLHADPDGSAE